MSEKSIALIGLGVLGSAIAEVLISNGFEVYGSDVDPDSRARALALGVAMRPSIAELPGENTPVLTCLPSSDALHAVVGELVASGVTGRTVIEVSTLPVAEKEKARASLAAAAMILLDCPLSGNRIMALQGQLTAFASGDEIAFAGIRSVLDGFCRDVHYIGPFGHGMKMKICGNILNLVHNSVAAEVMVLGMKSGLDPKTIHKVISGSGSSSRMFEVRGALMVDEDYRREGMNFSIPLKDARIISEHAASLYCPTPVYQAALQPYYAAVAQGHHDEDASAVCTALEQAANVQRDRSCK
ncbi:MAG: NAD(P)-dependent oxidoreductase [Rhodospirillales bacterium]|nr:NAD(P)-dependent oxidoreductase [Rhodospirillales bacterium]